MMVELEIFAQPLTTTVFLYASGAMVAALAAAVLWICRPKSAPTFGHPPSAKHASGRRAPNPA